MRFRPWRALDAVDRRLLRLLTRRERRSLERLLTRLTHGANRSLLWLVLAEIMAVAGGGGLLARASSRALSVRRPRRCRDRGWGRRRRRGAAADGTGMARLACRG